MQKTDHFESLLQTLFDVRADTNSEVPEDLLKAIVAAHIDETDDALVHRDVQQQIEGTMSGRSAAD